MLFMSEKQKDVLVRPSKKLFSPKTGEKIGTQKRVFAEFRRGGVPSWALPIALERFSMLGKPIETQPQMWLCVYDSAEDQKSRGWTDEERALIEQKLLSEHDIVLIEAQKVAAPTPNYVKLTTVQGKRTLELAAAKAVEIVTENGFDPDAVIAFERQENRRESEAIIAALAAVSTDEDVVEELVAS